MFLELHCPATKRSPIALYNNRPMAFALGDHQLEQQTTRAINHSKNSITEICKTIGKK
jgi:hypothetical protein